MPTKGLDRLLQFCSDWLCKLQLLSLPLFPSPKLPALSWSPICVWRCPLLSEPHYFLLHTGLNEESAKTAAVDIVSVSLAFLLFLFMCVCREWKSMCPHESENHAGLFFPLYSTFTLRQSPQWSGACCLARLAEQQDPWLSLVCLHSSGYASPCLCAQDLTWVLDIRVQAILLAQELLYQLNAFTVSAFYSCGFTPPNPGQKKGLGMAQK